MGAPHFVKGLSVDATPESWRKGEAGGVLPDAGRYVVKRPICRNAFKIIHTVIMCTWVKALTVGYQERANLSEFDPCHKRGSSNTVGNPVPPQGASTSSSNRPGFPLNRPSGGSVFLSVCSITSPH